MTRTQWRLYAVAGLVTGAALTVWVVRESGAALDLQALAANWPLVVLVSAWFTVPLAAAAESWRALFPHHGRPRALPALALTWIGLGVNWLLPVAMVGGEAVKYRLARAAAWPAGRLAASLVVDKTLQVATQILYLLIGAAMLLAMTGRLEWQAGGIVALAGFVLAVALFYRAQRAGMFSGLARAFARTGDGRGARRIDAAIRRVYRRRGALGRAALLRMLFRLLMAGEIVLVVAWLEPGVFGPGIAGLAALVAAGIVLESLAQGARAMAFFIPAGLGAQEGALIGAGLLLGLPAESVVLVALIKRAREVIVGGSGLVAWQVYEARNLSRPTKVQESSPRAR